MESKFYAIFNYISAIGGVDRPITKSLGWGDTKEEAKELCRIHRDKFNFSSDRYEVCEYADSDWKSKTASTLMKVTTHLL